MQPHQSEARGGMRIEWIVPVSNWNSCQERVVASLSGACRLTARSEVFRPAAERVGGSRRRTLTYACSGCVVRPASGNDCRARAVGGARRLY